MPYLQRKYTDVPILLEKVFANSITYECLEYYQEINNQENVEEIEINVNYFKE